MSLLLAVVVSLAISTLGWSARALTASGAAAATLVGAAILWRAGWPGGASLAAFFVGASLISRLAPDRSVIGFDAKGQRRDPWQVLANGGAAAVSVLLLAPPAARVWVATASLAAAAADTWATSSGGWSRRPPRHIVTGRPVPAGTSGGVTWLGSAGAAAGGGLVAAAGAVALGQWRLFAVAAGVGMLGMLADSLLGAACQGRFHCAGCQQPTERRTHRCGRPTTHIGGWAWLSNDGVNGLATALAALLGWLAWRVAA